MRRERRFTLNGKNAWRMPYGHGNSNGIAIRLSNDSNSSTCHRAVDGDKWILWRAGLRSKQSADCQAPDDFSLVIIVIRTPGWRGGANGRQTVSSGQTRIGEADGRADLTQIVRRGHFASVLVAATQPFATPFDAHILVCRNALILRSEERVPSWIRKRLPFRMPSTASVS